jgi:hypothetical protein
VSDQAVIELLEAMEATLVPGSAADVRDLFQQVVMYGYIEHIPQELAEGLDQWLRAHGGWFFDQQLDGYEEVREFEASIPIDNSQPNIQEVGPLLRMIVDYDDLYDLHERAYDIILAKPVRSPEGLSALIERVHEAS